MKIDNVKLVIFDVDGVLIDVSCSYLLAIKKTAEFFIGSPISMEEVMRIKNRGINNEHEATAALLREKGLDIRDRPLYKKFQEYYSGKDFKGLIQNESCIIKK